MAEEHRCEAPEGHRLCANNCGFFGSPATLNLCSKCYRDLRLKEEQASSAKSAVEKSLSSAAAAAAAASSTAPLSPPALTLPEAANEIAAPGAVAAAPSSTQPSRCSTCRKRVGLTGFRCRCGITFCGVHRYPEQHGCTFDFKKPGKEAISKANPVVKADKLHKI